MDIKDAVERLENSQIYKEWFGLNPDNYLAHMFTTMDSSKTVEWQVGYYSKKTDKITVFDLTDSEIKVMPPEEAFKEKNFIEELDLDIVNIGLEDAMNIVDKVLKDNYSAESVIKVIVLLQNLPEFELIWNMSIVTATFKVINIKINAQDGAVIQHSRESLLGWEKK